MHMHLDPTISTKNYLGNKILGRRYKYNKCIGDDTKDAARQSLNCIKNKKIKYGENDFQYAGWNSYTLQCGMWL